MHFLLDKHSARIRFTSYNIIYIKYNTICYKQYQYLFFIFYTFQKSD